MTIPLLKSERPVIVFSDEDVENAVTRSAYDKALDYVVDGAVLGVHVSPDGREIAAKVAGSRRQPYDQIIHLDVRPDGKVKIDGGCSCPMAWNCKHVAAALLSLLDEEDDLVLRETSPAPSPERTPPDLPSPRPVAVPAEVAAWLQSFENIKATETEDYPPDVRQRLYYVLSAPVQRQSVPELAVSLWTVRLKRDDTFAAKPGRYNIDNVFQPQPAKFLGPSDRRILRRLARGRYAGFGGNGVSLTGDEGVEILRDIIATGRARWGTLDGPVASEGAPRAGRIAWRLGHDGTQRPAIDLDDGLAPVRLVPPWYADGATGRLGPIDIDCPPRLLDTLLAAPPIPPAIAGVVRGEIARRVPGIDAASPRELAPPETVGSPPVPCLRLFVGEIPGDDSPGWQRRWSASGGRQREQAPLARLSYRYGPITIAATNRDRAPMLAHEGRLYRINRNARAETDARHRLDELGFDAVRATRYDWSIMDHADDLMIDGEGSTARWIEMLDTEVPKLRSSGWIVEIDENFPIRLARFSGEITADLGEGSGIDWFELGLGTMVDGARVDLVPPLLAVIESLGPKADLAAMTDDSTVSVRLPDGRILPLPFHRIRPIVAALLELFQAGAIDGKSRQVRFSLLGAADAAALEEATSAAGLIWRGGERLRELGRKLRETGGIAPTQLPDEFRATLRPYQARGIDWLQFLRGAGIGGILADDMGLGKTVQTLGHLAIEKASGRMDRPALVVCPTSLVANWKMEAARFAPSLSVIALHGNDRKSRFGDIAKHDLVITTYPLLARDHEILTAQGWHIAILDEAQIIKNPDAITTRLAARLEARQRLCLSGTPLENHLGELWSLFTFLSPGFLGDRESFRRRFRTPIEKQGDNERRALLARRVRPFLLRRTKEEVVLDLPPKTEIVEPIEMGGPQASVYDSIRLAMHAKVQAAIAAKGLARSGIVILDALLKLRQVCCEPRLLKTGSARTAKAGSAKLERLMELVPDLLNQGRKVLLFSQFTSMLALIEEALDERGIARVVLTGDTRDRETPIRRFQSGAVDLFLISLKAGGTGLNLTAADTVILYDPWWNPAVEDQASGRAHRIGQEKAVFVHKLVTLGTIEEKMEQLKARKRELVAGILEAERGATLTMTEADIEALFAPVPG